MDPQLAVLFAVLSAVLAVVGILLGIRNWVYGGSVVRVEFELARTSSWGAIITRPIAAWKSSTGEELQPSKTLPGTQVDLAKVTVRNLGRTSATVYDVGLRIGRPPSARGSWTAQPQFFTDAGETEDRVRLEAHDVRVFYFHIIPILRGARIQFGEGDLAVRAAVNTGVGKWRLSRRWRRGRWNVWVVQGDQDRSIIGKPLTSREQARLWVELLRDFDGAREIWVRQIADQAADEVDAGLSRDEVCARVLETHRLFGTPPDQRAEEFYIRMLVDNLIALRDREE
ncbi:hypothetical protein E4V99_12540 [Microbacterium sp. dk485]|uniref:hypothetical protein n=1 Tax=Microbacterium sp. dk485 TaxID=2560021 RepID=UPI0010734B85|nr:hypothetical protein [Microbacterium sp. dk485]TFV81786.1 hypothetical protein E4V99_12540 [Microbacterium sp. dk485]